MELLHKDDIEVLDYIVKESKKVTTLKAEMLKPINLLKPLGDVFKDFDYKRYFEILKEWQVVDVKQGFNDDIYIQSKPDITSRFIASGGFDKKYAEQQERIRIENILEEKALDEAKVIKWTKNTYWLSVTIVFLSFVISIIALIVAILKP